MCKPTIIITSGEPAGIGPDIVAAIEPARFNARLVVIGDRDMLTRRARALGSQLEYTEYCPTGNAANSVALLHQPLAQVCQPGKVDKNNAAYVLALLRQACQGCLRGDFDAMVTAPVHKEVINRSGVAFSGHTEFLAELCASPTPVMLLHTAELRVALLTTHLPLRAVADAVTRDAIYDVVKVLHRDLSARFGIAEPHIKVCGLNPHAGENGYLGREEIDTIIPALEALKTEGVKLSGPYPADTLFTKPMLADADAILAMYHDQGLPVLKHLGFHDAVNTTLGLPIIRTSVDHGTALELAGTNRARADSLYCAIEAAISQTDSKRNARCA